MHELFDVIGGTSTGGILAAGIQEQLPLETLEQVLKNGIRLKS